MHIYNFHPGRNSQSGGSSVPEISDRMSCTTCQCTFDSREEQKEHYTLDWHRFNLKRRIKGAGALSEEDFQDKTQAGDLSSISGSDLDSSDEDDSVTSTELIVESSLDLGYPNRSPRVLFRNGQGKLLSVYRCVLGVTKDMEVSPGQLLSFVKSLQDRPTMVILMAGGGHFAGAVFKGKEVLKHKTFHRYTVRAKRGTSQALHDAQNRSHMAKSAGAALRRYNQAALMAEINQVLQNWTEDIGEARGIFLRAPRSDKTLFLGRNSPIQKKDPRVYSIPFCTRRATFREIQHVHTLLFTLQVHDKIVPVTGTRGRPVRSRRPRRTENQEEIIDTPELSEEDDPVLEEFVEEELTISTLDLREHEVQPRRKRKKKKKKDVSESAVAQDEAELGSISQRQIDHSTDDYVGEELAIQEPPLSALEGDELSRLRNSLFTCCKTGDSESAKQILQDLLPDFSPSPSPQTKSPASEVVSGLVNERLPLEQRTLLHVAAAAGHGEVACLLMNAGWDPALRDSAAQTPYSVCADKRTRNAFRKYREDNPDKYNYGKSQIPGPVSEEVEARRTEKKKAQKAQRKEKEKEEKEERLRREVEEAEKKRFAALSDREKRALAAERRLAAQLSLSKETSVNNVRRCWLCGESLLGKVPFEYLEFSFCSTRCLHEHRRSQSDKSQQ
ncbi:PREDICTED: ankyrin repeat and zinc finger domain-containing protein 1 [Nanorana parkeri]|uniref:ankyrin repeat and zinc finger domain-containing protein 1 n=1 Tax=Nanorana parkeri TaxID=125878 RepID=UPI000854A22E|nr:PREDICTED: ankyrin repeat and zinc finger domain-containing protein 1 [Nanorana parkeri]